MEMEIAARRKRLAEIALQVVFSDAVALEITRIVLSCGTHENLLSTLLDDATGSKGAEVIG